MASEYSLVRAGEDCVFCKNIISLSTNKDNTEVKLIYYKTTYTDSSMEYIEKSVYNVVIEMNEFLKYNPNYSEILTGQSVESRKEQNKLSNDIDCVLDMYRSYRADHSDQISHSMTDFPLQKCISNLQKTSSESKAVDNRMVTDTNTHSVDESNDESANTPSVDESNDESNDEDDDDESNDENEENSESNCECDSHNGDDESLNNHIQSCSYCKNSNPKDRMECNKYTKLCKCLLNNVLLE